MEKKDFLYMNTTALAYMGDAVYEMYVRDYLLRSGKAASNILHRAAVKFVRAEAQANAIRSMLDTLSEEELSLVKRARNRRSASKPKNADPVEYKWATAFEALIGYLYLTEDRGRMEEIVNKAIAGAGKDVKRQ